MTRNPLKDGNISENSAGIGTVTRQMVLGRAEELAIINGDWLHKVSSSDFEQPRDLELRLARAVGAFAKCTLHRQSSCRLQ
jgi:hypothetical protein